MWITLWSDDFPSSLRAFLSSDGVWFFMGSDVARLLNFSNTTNFNRRYTCFKLKDTVNRCLWREIPERILNSRVVDLETLMKKFGKSALHVLHRIFEGDSENFKAIRSGSQTARMDLNSCPVIRVINRDHVDFLDYRITMAEFLQNYRMKILEFYEYKMEGTMLSCKSLMSVDAPMRYVMEFADGVVINYQRMEE